MSPATALADQAEEFARQISEILSAFTGTDCPFDAVTVDGQAVIRQRVSPGDPEGIGLNSNGQTLLSMVVRYECTWDSDKQYLSVETSAIKVYPLRRVNKEPLFRYEYIRTPDGTIPSAHLQVHAHRDSFTHLLGWAGQHSARARQRSAAPMDQTPSLSKFHFPLGGPRFRPSIEDVLDVLQEEFGLETGSQWQEV